MSRKRNARSASPAPAEETVRTVTQGDVIGFIAANGAHVWRSIPFGADTGGTNRWRPPKPARSWAGRLETLAYRERCAQLTNQGDEDDGFEPGIVVGSEDCLTLDVFAPASAPGQNLPVMVWLHGGGNVWGGTWNYDGSRLAVNEDVIVVAVQFRVGPLGWFAHEAIRSSATEPEGKAACFATLDQIESLRWVSTNIASFGGDPDRVTVFGESSGGHNVAVLLASPLAAGLFHRAIIQSGSFDSVPLAEAEGLEGSQANPARSIADRLGVTTAEDLRSAAVEELYAACDSGDSWFLDVPRVIQDGVVIPRTPLRQAFASRESFNSVPIITGTNRDEMKLFFASDASMIRRRLGVLLEARDQDFFDAKAEYLSRIWRVRSVDEPAAAMNRAGHDEVWAYRFDWDGGGKLLMMDFGELFGAAHGFEVPFVFNSFHHLGDADRVLFTRRSAEAREQLSRRMGRYWATFARDGTPSANNGRDWPPYVFDGGSYLRLDTEDSGGIEAIAEADTLEHIATDLHRDPRLDEVEKRMIIDELAKWMFTRPVRDEIAATAGSG